MSILLSVRWLAVLVLTITAVLVATEFGDITIHIAVAALSALIFAVWGVRNNAQLTTAGASPHAIGASSARHMGVVWIWGAAILGISYMFLIPPWREWLHFFAAFAVVGLLCIVFSSALERDAESNSDDQTLLKLGRILTIGQVIGMLALLVGLTIDPDKSMLKKIRPDWAANIVFVFGGLALLVISAHALWQQRGNAKTG